MRVRHLVDGPFLAGGGWVLILSSSERSLVPVGLSCVHEIAHHFGIDDARGCTPSGTDEARTYEACLYEARTCGFAYGRGYG
jgi:hypothetical protein